MKKMVSRVFGLGGSSRKGYIYHYAKKLNYGGIFASCHSFDRGYFKS